VASHGPPKGGIPNFFVRGSLFKLPFVFIAFCGNLVFMQKVLTAEQMREVDRLTTERFGIPSILLMENAAHAAARVVIERLGGDVVGKAILVLCGKGNNGGDGAAVARILRQAGAETDVILFGKVEDTKGDARANFQTTETIANCFNEIESLEEWDKWFAGARQDWLVVIDAIFGTGLDRPVYDWLAHIISQINIADDARHDGAGRRLAISIDIPSGLNADLAEPIGETFHADITVTFTAPKSGNVLPPASRFNGKLVVADIGSPQELIDTVDSGVFLAIRDDAVDWLTDAKYTPGSYKNKRGHALIIAGSKNYTGAAVLCGDSAIRSGTGLVTLAVPEGSRESVVARISPEVMVRGISETKTGSAAEKAVNEVGKILCNVDVVAVGSGLSSQEQETSNFIRRIVEDRKTPVVIDADGLTALSPFSISGSEELPLILTPHEGEFMRLLGSDDKSLIKDRVSAVRDFAVKHHVILVLKGERVLVGEPGGDVAVIPTGNPGLGKAGNGDTLTGIITGFTAQAVQMKLDMFETAVAAVYVAGMAGDIAESKWGKRVMTASDVRECFVEVFEELGERESEKVKE
jgi:NAD(P)H-hydrate epimerase